MQLDEKIYYKFPAVLRNKLINKEIEFPDETKFEYNQIYTYRAVGREKDDFSEVNKEDFRSYAELGKKARGVQGDFTKMPEYYGVSSFLKKEIVEQKMKFPNPHKKMAAGYVYQEGGPQYTNLETQHVCWWLYEDADISNFKIIG